MLTRVSSIVPILLSLNLICPTWILGSEAPILANAEDDNKSDSSRYSEKDHSDEKSEAEETQSSSDEEEKEEESKVNPQASSFFAEQSAVAIEGSDSDSDLEDFEVASQVTSDSDDEDAPGNATLKQKSQRVYVKNKHDQDLEDLHFEVNLRLREILLVDGLKPLPSKSSSATSNDMQLDQAKVQRLINAELTNFKIKYPALVRKGMENSKLKVTLDVGEDASIREWVSCINRFVVAGFEIPPSTKTKYGENISRLMLEEPLITALIRSSHIKLGKDHAIRILMAYGASANPVDHLGKEIAATYNYDNGQSPIKHIIEGPESEIGDPDQRQLMLASLLGMNKRSQQPHTMHVRLSDGKNPKSITPIITSITANQNYSKMIRAFIPDDFEEPGPGQKPTTLSFQPKLLETLLQFYLFHVDKWPVVTQSEVGKTIIYHFEPLDAITNAMERLAENLRNQSGAELSLFEDFSKVVLANTYSEKNQDPLIKIHIKSPLVSERTKAAQRDAVRTVFYPEVVESVVKLYNSFVMKKPLSGKAKVMKKLFVADPNQIEEGGLGVVPFANFPYLARFLMLGCYRDMVICYANQVALENMDKNPAEVTKIFNYFLSNEDEVKFRVRWRGREILLSRFNRNWENCLTRAAFARNYDVVKTLLQKSIFTLDVPNQMGQNVLHAIFILGSAHMVTHRHDPSRNARLVTATGVSSISELTKEESEEDRIVSVLNVIITKKDEINARLKAIETKNDTGEYFEGEESPDSPRVLKNMIINAMQRRDSQGYTPLFYAAKRGFPRAFELILDTLTGWNQENIPLHFADGVSPFAKLVEEMTSQLDLLRDQEKPLRERSDELHRAPKASRSENAIRSADDALNKVRRKIAYFEKYLRQYRKDAKNWDAADKLKPYPKDTSGRQAGTREESMKAYFKWRMEEEFRNASKTTKRKDHDVFQSAIDAFLSDPTLNFYDQFMKKKLAKETSTIKKSAKQGLYQISRPSELIRQFNMATVETRVSYMMGAVKVVEDKLKATAFKKNSGTSAGAYLTFLMGERAGQSVEQIAEFFLDEVLKRFKYTFAEAIEELENEEEV